MGVVKESLRVLVFLLVSPGAVHVFLIHQLLNLTVVHTHTGTVENNYDNMCVYQCNYPSSKES